MTEDVRNAAERVENARYALQQANEELRRAINDACETYSQNAVSAWAGVSAAFLSDVRHGNRTPGEKLVAGCRLSKLPKAVRP